MKFDIVAEGTAGRATMLTRLTLVAATGLGAVQFATGASLRSANDGKRVTQVNVGGLLHLHISTGPPSFLLCGGSRDVGTNVGTCTRRV